MLIPLPFHGQSPQEDVDAVFSEPSVLASTGKYPLGQSKGLFTPESFEMFSAPPAFQELWAAHRERGLRDLALCAPMLQNQGSLSTHGRSCNQFWCAEESSTDVRTGATVNALQTWSKAQLLQQLGRSGRTDCGVHITMMSHGQYLSQVRSADLAQLEETEYQPYDLTSFVAGRSFARHVPTWNFGYKRCNKDGTCHSMHGSTV